MAAHAVVAPVRRARAGRGPAAVRFTLPTLAALAALLASSPGAALACPYCAGRAGGGVATGVVLGSFVFLPFIIAWTVYRFIVHWREAE